jgi:predicted acyltransferase
MRTLLILILAAASTLAAPRLDSLTLAADGQSAAIALSEPVAGTVYLRSITIEWSSLSPEQQAATTALLGALAGQWLRSDRSGSRKAAGLALAGVVSLAVGYLWGFAFPIIKILWTSSYVLFAAGWSLLLLALFYWAIDVVGLKRWAFFFVVIGMNPITIYFLDGIIDFPGIAEGFLGGVAAHAGIYAALILPFGALMIRWLLLWFLYRHKIFFRV